MIQQHLIGHSDELTIYCYKDSVAHKYAVENNIKFVLIEKTTEPTTSGDNTNTEEPKNTDTANSGEETPKTNVDKVTPKVDPEEDKTIVQTILPNTGASIGIIVATLAVVASSIFAYYKCFKLKDVK